ncbi:MAG: FAD binding domain-containing protein [Planctomycetales bacterium]|nr:FAD binding domain-containing protein [Planctomycetales bacterium]
MKAFAYAEPQTEADALGVLADPSRTTEILAGGTDVIGLMKKMIVTPDVVVNIMEIDALKRIETQPDGGLKIGAAVTLDMLLDSPDVARWPAVQQAISSFGSLQLQCQSTIGGDLCQRPQCWYFRSGHGLLAAGGTLVAQGDNRHHAIFGNDGPAKFVSGSRVGPALIAHGASVRVASAEGERVVPLASLFRTPRHEAERETTLRRGELLTHVLLPANDGWTSGVYEVRASEGPDYPLAAAAAALKISAGVVRQANIVLGQVAPTPWISEAAAHAIEGMPVSEAAAEAAGQVAVQAATPLKDNAYKVRLAKTCVKRAILRAAGFSTGGFE